MKERLSMFSRAVAIVYRSAGGLTLSLVLLSLTSGMLPLALIWAIKRLIDTVSEAALTGSYDLTEAVLLYIVAIALIYLAEESITSLISLVRKRQSFMVESEMFSRLHSKSVSLDLLHFESPEYYDILARASREAPYRPSSIVANLTSLLRSAISLLLMSGLLVLLNGWLLALLIAASIPGVWLRIHYSSVLYNFRKEQSPTARKAAYFNWLLTGDRPSRELRLFGLGTYFSGLFREHFDKQQTEEISIVRKRTTIEVLTSFFTALAVLLAVWYIADRTINRWITIGDMAMYLLAFRMGLTYLRQALSSIAGLYEDNLFIGDLFAFLNLEEKVKALSPVAEKGDFTGSLAMENLTFSYPGSERKILDGLNLELRKGETLALVGANGAGKTTLARLLTRLYDPDSGSVMIDGKDIRHINPGEYRQHFSVLFQDFMLYNISAADNIRAGDIRRSEDRERLEKAAAMAGIHDFILELPAGYETVLGRLFDDSRELSWGEWQKIALARALFRESDILILDEPASALDAESEYELFTRFREIARGRTCLLISHRFSNVSIADRIALLENGAIRESGSHDELMNLKGEYARLYRLQQERYS